MKHRYVLWVAAAVLAAFGYLLLPAVVASGETEESAKDGKALFVDVHKCNMCHSVEAAGIEAKTKSKAMLGGDLSAGTDVELAELAAFLRKEAPLGDTASHKKEFKGTDEELQTILDWLGSLEATETE